MSVYNSSLHGNHDESDITIINASMMSDHDEHGSDRYIPIIQRLQTSSQGNETERADGESNPNRNDHEYIIVDQDRRKHAEQLEKVLKFYIQDVKQDNNNMWNCNRQLMIRLMDLIRPAYSTDQKKMIELDGVLREIGELHEQRFLAEKEKEEKFHAEISRLNGLIFTRPTETMIITNNPDQDGSMTLPNVTNDALEHWTEINDDTEKLQQIVESQQAQIVEILNLMSQAGMNGPLVKTVEPISPEPIEIATPNAVKNDPTTEKKPPTEADNVPNTLLQRLQQFVIPAARPNHDPLPLVNHSPGISPTHSLSTLTSDIINPPVEPEPIREIAPENPPVIDPPPLHNNEPTDQYFDSFLQEINAPKEQEECPVCHKLFPIKTEEERDAVFDHVEKCLFKPKEGPPAPAAAPAPQDDLSCPNCNQKFPHKDELIYLQHVTDCFDRA